MANTIRKLVTYTGRVQGVGFRATTRSISRGFAVAGYVKNLPDGRVELAAEGEPAVVAGFLASVREVLGRYITDEQTDVRGPQGETGFAIRR
ncbi:MAG: acylphosphatase [Planctomycetota bacterium]